MHTCLGFENGVILNLLLKDSEWSWESAQVQALSNVKDAFCSVCVMTNYVMRSVQRIFPPARYHLVCVQYWCKFYQTMKKAQFNLPRARWRRPMPDTGKLKRKLWRWLGWPNDLKGTSNAFKLLLKPTISHLWRCWKNSLYFIYYLTFSVSAWG